LEISHRGKRRSLLAEEALLVGFDADGHRLESDVSASLEGQPAGDLPDAVKKRQLTSAHGRLRELAPALDALARERAEALTADHIRVRQAAESRQARIGGSVEVEPVLPPDIIGFYLLLPVID
jgi:hypothetical protein